MPQYTFYCEPCNLQFKRRLSMGEHPGHSCPNCKTQAGRQWSGQPLLHNFAATPATAKANSGVAQHDYPTADNLVGRSAEMRWTEQMERNRAKEKVRKEGGAVALARKDTSEQGKRVSEYTTLGQTQFDARKKLEGAFREEAKVRGVHNPVSGKAR